MNYYILQESNNEKYLVETTIDNMSMLRGFKTTLATSLGENFPILDISITYFRIIPDYFYAGPFLLVSEKLKNLFSNLKTDFEYYSVNIKNKTSKNILKNYYYAHLLSEYDFINRVNSVYEVSEYNQEYIEDIEVLVLKKNIDLSLSYLEKCLDRSFILINENIAKALLENKITGIELKIIDENKND